MTKPDIHNLTGDAAEMRATLLENADLSIAAGIAAGLANSINDAVNNCQLPVATSILCRALIANAVLETASDWWAIADDPRAIKPNTHAVLRSFTTDLPPDLIGESYIPEGQE